MKWRAWILSGGVRLKRCKKGETTKEFIIYLARSILVFCWTGKRTDLDRFLLNSISLFQNKMSTVSFSRSSLSSDLDYPGALSRRIIRPPGLPGTDKISFFAVMTLMKACHNVIVSIIYYSWQVSKGIRQYLINWCTSPIMISQYYPFCRLQLVVETFGHSI